MQTTVVRKLAAGSLLLAAGTALGWAVRNGEGGGTPKAAPENVQRQAETRREPATQTRVSVPAVEQHAIRAAVREAVQEELAQARAEAAVRAEAENAESEPSAEVLEQLDSGHRYVEAAIASGRWGTEQASYIRRVGLGMTGEQYHELIRPLAIAINEGRVELSGEDTPF